MALCSLENKDARARFGILKGLHSARQGWDSVTAFRRISQNGSSRNKPPDQGTRGVSGHRRHAKDLNPRLSNRRRRLEELPKGSTRHAGSAPPRAQTSTEGTSPGTTRRVTPSKRNSESSERFRRDRSVGDGLRRSCARCKQLPQGCQRRPSICRYTRAPE